MERSNIFHLVHKGLRASLYQTALHLQQTDFTAEESEEVLNRVREVVMLFEGHAQKENNYILPAIQEFEPAVAATFREEHTENIQLGEQLQNCMTSVETSIPKLERIIAGRELCEVFVAFMVFNLRHMAKEEAIINKILWRYYTDLEIKQIAQRIGHQTPPWIQEFYSTWMLRGINNMEAVNWIKSVENGMPSIAFQTLLQKAAQELPGKRFHKVTAALSEGERIA